MIQPMNSTVPVSLSRIRNTKGLSTWNGMGSGGPARPWDHGRNSHGDTQGGEEGVAAVIQLTIQAKA
jgi:hypothetical protein